MKSKQEMLASFKKANQDAKLRMAKKAGFGSKEDYLASLTGKRVKKAVVKPLIHVVDILDASGSMEGGKYNNAKMGITSSLSDLRNNKKADFTYTFIEFIQNGTVETHNFLSSVPNSVGFYGATGRNTPLYKTVHDALNRLMSAVDSKSKVLVKVYTDGLNNAAQEYREMAADLIKKLQKKNFTITFVATDGDMKYIVEALGLDESNTLAVENSAEGFRKAFKSANEATMMYTSAVASGQNVTRGFYKKVGKL